MPCASSQPNLLLLQAAPPLLPGSGFRIGSWLPPVLEISGAEPADFVSSVTGVSTSTSWSIVRSAVDDDSADDIAGASIDEAGAGELQAVTNRTNRAMENRTAIGVDLCMV